MQTTACPDRDRTCTGLFVVWNPLSALGAKEVLVHLPAVLEWVERRVRDLLGPLHPFLCWASCGVVLDVLEGAVGCAGAASHGAWHGHSGQEACLNAQVLWSLL